MYLIFRMDNWPSEYIFHFLKIQVHIDLIFLKEMKKENSEESNRVSRLSKKKKKIILEES